MGQPYIYICIYIYIYMYKTKRLDPDLGVIFAWKDGGAFLGCLDCIGFLPICCCHAVEVAVTALPWPPPFVMKSLCSQCMESQQCSNANAMCVVLRFSQHARFCPAMNRGQRRGLWLNFEVCLYGERCSRNAVRSTFSTEGQPVFLNHMDLWTCK